LRLLLIPSLIDWSTINLDAPKANPSYQLPANYKDLPIPEFINLLYKEILNRAPDEGGYKNWENQLNNNVPREQVANFFYNVAREEVAKTAKTDIWDIVDKSRPNKRLIFCCKESAGDVAICTALLKSVKNQFENYDIYWMSEQKYHPIIEGNPYIHKILPWIEPLSQEMFSIGAGQESQLFHA